MNTKELIACPFVYSNGRKCDGVVVRVRAYGKRTKNHQIEREEVHKYRLWCNSKGDHCGCCTGFDGKYRMEFYPSDLPSSVLDAIWKQDLVE